MYSDTQRFRTNPHHRSVPKLQNVPVRDARFDYYANAILNSNRDQNHSQAKNGGSDYNPLDEGSHEDRSNPFEYAHNENEHYHQRNEEANMANHYMQSYQTHADRMSGQMSEHSAPHSKFPCMSSSILQWEIQDSWLSLSKHTLGK